MNTVQKYGKKMTKIGYRSLIGFEVHNVVRMVPATLMMFGGQVSNKPPIGWQPGSTFTATRNVGITQFD